MILSSWDKLRKQLSDNIMSFCYFGLRINFTFESYDGTAFLCAFGIIDGLQGVCSGVLLIGAVAKDHSILWN